MRRYKMGQRLPRLLLSAFLTQIGFIDLERVVDFSKSSNLPYNPFLAGFVLGRTVEITIPLLSVQFKLLRHPYHVRSLPLDDGSVCCGGVHGTLERLLGVK